MVTSVEDLTTRREGTTPRIEVAAAILLGLAAVAISFSSYQSALWGGVQDAALTDSVLASNSAVDQLQNGDTIASSDQALFTAMLTSGACGTLEDLLNLELGELDVLTPCGQLVLGLSEGGFDAVVAWQFSDDAYPFSTEEYDAVLYTSGEEMQASSREFFDESQDANRTGDKYELASTFLTVVLFFAGISFVLASMRLRRILVIGSALLLAGSAVYLLGLPKTF